MRRSAASAYRELRPQAFGEWLREREVVRDRSGSGTGSPEQAAEQEQGVERSFAQIEEQARFAGVEMGR